MTPCRSFALNTVFAWFKHELSTQSAKSHVLKVLANFCSTARWIIHNRGIVIYLFIYIFTEDSLASDGWGGLISGLSSGLQWYSFSDEKNTGRLLANRKKSDSGATISKALRTTVLPRGGGEIQHNRSAHWLPPAKCNCCCIVPTPLFWEHYVRDMNERSISYYSAHLSVCNTPAC